MTETRGSLGPGGPLAAPSLSVLERRTALEGLFPLSFVSARVVAARLARGSKRVIEYGIQVQLRSNGVRALQARLARLGLRERASVASSESMVLSHTASFVRFRRFREFRELARAVRKDVPGLSVPPRTLFRSTEASFVRERQAALDRLLARLEAHAPWTPRSRAVLARFLCVSPEDGCVRATEVENGECEGEGEASDSVWAALVGPVLHCLEVENNTHRLEIVRAEDELPEGYEADLGAPMPVQAAPASVPTRSNATKPMEAPATPPIRPRAGHEADPWAAAWSEWNRGLPSGEDLTPERARGRRVRVELGADPVFGRHDASGTNEKDGARPAPRRHGAFREHRVRFEDADDWLAWLEGDVLGWRASDCGAPDGGGRVLGAKNG